MVKNSKLALVVPLAMCLPWGALACASAPSGAAEASISAPPSYSMSSQPQLGISSPEGRSISTSAIVVRPDLLTTTFRIQSDGVGPQALSVLQARVGELLRRARDKISDRAMVRVTGLAFTDIHREKTRDGERATVVDGCIELPLPDALDYWARAGLLVKLDEMTRNVTSEMKVRDAAPRIEIAFGTPRAALKDPEAYRAALTRAWLERAQGFASAAESKTAHLELLDCTPPDEILVSPISVEEVSLSLKVNCRLGVPNTIQVAHPPSPER